MLVLAHVTPRQTRLWAKKMTSSSSFVTGSLILHSTVAWSPLWFAFLCVLNWLALSAYRKIHVEHKGLNKQEWESHEHRTHEHINWLWKQGSWMGMDQLHCSKHMGMLMKWKEGLRTAPAHAASKCRFLGLSNQHTYILLQQMFPQQGTLVEWCLLITDHFLSKSVSGNNQYDQAVNSA